MRLRSRMIAPLSCIHKGVNLSSMDIARLRQANTANLLKEKKLVLLLDLDNTLLHTVSELKLSSEEEFCLQWADSTEDDDPNKSMFRGEGLITKLRPHARTFLREASKMFDLFIYTMGCRNYALRMAKYLDPEGVYFQPSKVISREDCTQPNQKGLDVVLGDERIVVILDDNKFVWTRHSKNLIKINRFFFFGSRHLLSVLTEVKNKRNRALLGSLKVLRRVHRLFFDRVDLSNSDVRQYLLLKMSDGVRLAATQDGFWWSDV